jgi:nitrite reductase/ring-hydroxylating ferredoxin subunit
MRGSASNAEAGCSGRAAKGTGSSMAEIELCKLDDIPEGGSKGFLLDYRQPPAEIFVVRRDGEVRAYVNSCPHTGAPLDWMPDQFLNLDKTLIQCATHHALFRIEDGYCVAGPCAGASLSPVPVKLRHGRVLVVGPVERHS